MKVVAGQVTDERGSFIAVVAAFCLVGMGVVGQMYVTIPLIPRISAAWQVTPEVAVWATSAFAIAYACGSLASGPLSNRWGRRSVMVTGVVVMAVATALVPLATSLGTGSLLRALQGLPAGVFVPMVYAHLSATIPRRRLPLALTMVSASMGGTVVMGQVQAQLIEAAFGWRAVFWITAPLVLAGAVAVHRVMRPTAALSSPADLRGGEAVRSLNPPVRLMPLYAITLLVAGSLTAIYTAVQLYGPAEVVADQGAMLALRASALPALLCAVLIAPVLGRRFPIDVRVIGAFTVAAAGMTGTALFAGSAIGVGAALFVFMIGISTAGPALVQAVGSGAGAKQTTAIAGYGFMLNIGGGIGAQLPLLFTDFADLALLVAVVLGGAIVFLVVRRRSSRAARRDRTTPFE